MPLSASDVLFEDNHLLVINKRAPLATMGAEAGRPSLIAEAKDYIREKYKKPGNVFLGVVSRLDTLVTGAVVLARTSKAAARLSKQFRDREVEKIYWAVVAGSVRPSSAHCIDWVARHAHQFKVIAVDENHPDAQEAQLEYETIECRTAPNRLQQTLLQIKLLTGRKHQIRIQCSIRGFPILGDKKYGSDAPFDNSIALHARSLTIQHPTKRTEMNFLAPVPKAWRRLGFKATR